MRWLIRRFLDPKARFRFVPGLSHRTQKRDVRFDMADAEFTHEGDRCAAHRDDAVRIERAAAVFDDLYASFLHPPRTARGRARWSD